MRHKPDIAIIGPGRIGTALALSLSNAGYRISEIISRRVPDKAIRALGRKIKARTRSLPNARLDAGLIWVCVPDREIATVAHQLSRKSSWKDKLAFHCSGALTSDELTWLREKGAAVASVHPLMTFVARIVPSLQDVPFAIEGDRRATAAAYKIVRDLGAQPSTIRKLRKPAYHAWGAFASPLLVALLATAEKVGRAAGMSREQARRKMLPIVRQTISNYAALGPVEALSGPLTRGDAKVVVGHLRALHNMPAASAVYLALSRAAVNDLVEKTSRISKALR